MSPANHPAKPVQLKAGAGRLAGRRIIVTGAASGIGRTTAQLFVSEGAVVTLFDRNAGGLEKAAQEISAGYYPVDITVEPDVAEATEKAAAAMGGIDGLVNAAGIMSRSPPMFQLTSGDASSKSI